MEDHAQARRFGRRHDPRHRGQPAAPGDVGLQDVDQPVTDRVLERERGVPMLTGRERLPGQSRAHRGMGVQVLRDEAFLHPLQAKRAQQLGQPDGVLLVEGHPAVEHQLDGGPGQFAPAGHQVLVPP